MSLINTIGTIAAVISTASFVPQVWHTFKTRDVSGISLGMYSVFTVGVSCWLIYGLLLGAWPSWPHSQSWGYYPSGTLGLVLVIVLVLALLGRI